MGSMINLNFIRKDIQNIAEAISSVLEIDVTIVDSSLVRIAGTGTYFHKIGQQLEEYSAFKYSLTTKKELIIEDPKSNEICNECYTREVCKEFAEVCCPIVYDDKSYGVIGLIAFTKEQADVIKFRKDDLMNFLHKMADLISSKLKAEIKTYEVELEKKKLKTLLDNMDKAVVSLDKDANIEKYNLKFKEIFEVKGNIIGSFIGDVLNFAKDNNFNNINNDKSCSFTYRGAKKEFKGIYNIKPIILNEELKGYVLDFIDKVDAIKNYNKISNDHKIYLENIIGSSYAINKSKEEALMASKTNSTVLITGESGTGKELFARAIHNHSCRAGNPFIAINCAAIPDNLLESELFGYEEGAFTGAKKGGSLGKFELADKGSIFLDEIGDMSLHLQAKLLRVLQEKEVDKIGAKHNVSIDVRIIAATNKDLEHMVRKGTFREDLYYRLNVIPVVLPTLRQRKNDIHLLIEYMMKEYSNKLDKNVQDIDLQALEYLCEYSWPGNIRELQNVIEYSVNRCEGKIITLDNLPNRIKRANSNEDQIIESNENIKTLDELEKKEIIKALEKYKDYKKDKDLAAKALGISRATLYRKIERYKIVSK
ncbi:sigma 54-interacting transcriptional regulator [Paraclostridium bifermentans]|uniref:AAA family ATPase n=2 Tax=Peptostreptococcaceae TaxID=186804 RepID=A0A1X2JGR5_PARBF|nr:MULTISPECIES: sigma 54-interacting transcriptional regulator [Paraclostridium]MCU9806759.1 sigma 54-interacting transcriptional regulator [Paraclostridium sp. AKS46]MBN8048169.1 sigma 54-interacting transcriptional regulator [Paraclostridium bifermentans]MBZ6005479.1 sigma 54-interacting transcriptional regulator [Paraclostridium bifermentans]MCR1876463.1 sigma 54-interacting transcriptional regulator [Paraclostridium bifermentans]MDU0297661.1 sigma 54-interacting transcriptional regulator 